MLRGARFFAFYGVIAAGCAAGSAKRPAQFARPDAQAPASATDPNRARAQQLIAILAAGDADGAERDFSATMRAELPPRVLGLTWRTLLARSGPFEASRIVMNDHLLGKDRFTLELDFAQRSMLALVVFEPKSAQVIGLFFSEAATQARTPPSGLADPQVEDVALTVGAVPNTALGASLTLPKARGEHLVPGMVLVPGSGPADRDETMQRAKPFRDLAYGLAHHGVATLRFDKRTYAHPQAFDVKRSTVEEEVLADAIAAVRLMAARPEIDAHRIFVVGHSLGALLAPEIAERAGGVAGLVLLAAPGRPPLEIMLEQMRNSGASTADIATLEAKVNALPQLPATETLLGVPVHYLQDLSARDEMATAVRLHVPVLYLRGQLDRNVSAVDQSNWAHALTGQVPFTEATLPGLNHLFLPDGASLASDVHVRDEVSARIAAFAAQ